jgi:hypothetical protein
VSSEQVDKPVRCGADFVRAFQVDQRQCLLESGSGARPAMASSLIRSRRLGSVEETPIRLAAHLQGALARLLAQSQTDGLEYRVSLPVPGVPRGLCLLCGRESAVPARDDASRDG